MIFESITLNKLWLILSNGQKRVNRGCSFKEPPTFVNNKIKNASLIFFLRVINRCAQARRTSRKFDSVIQKFL